MSNDLKGVYLMAVPENWKTKHLILLVGGNPLPNYVAGKILLQDGGKLHLIHSTDTRKIAEHIGNQFGKENSKWYAHPCNDPASRDDIESALYSVLQECGSESVGLNYTGGTKAMSVHAYSAIKSKVAVATYLDSRTLTLRRMDDQATERIADVQFAVEPTLDNLMDLHNISVQKGRIRNETIHDEFNKGMGASYANPETANLYEIWCQRYLRNFKNIQGPARDDLDKAINAANAQETDERKIAQLGMDVRAIMVSHDTELVEKSSRLPVNPVPLSEYPALVDVNNALRKLIGIAETDETLDLSGYTNKELRSLIRHMDGDWVENLTMQALQQIASKCRLREILMTIDTDARPGQYNFEFDVVAMRGYQLYAFSCTRSADNGLCKTKLFEASIRATQLGGSEARVALVCAHPAPNKLKAQVKKWWYTEDPQFEVFGAPDLGNLPEKFKEWFDSNKKVNQ
ncbi:MAG: DUF1887 family protein [Caldilineaceae bacterium]|nr:DUF1887 family protein [Caldilineaceae bacterium]